MKKDKYYTPDISDIRMRYECEIQGAKTTGNDWIFPIKDNKIINDKIWRKGKITYHALETMFKCYKGECWNIRTPYLTVSQLKKEGWTICNSQIISEFQEPDTVCLSFMDNIVLFSEHSSRIRLTKGTSFIYDGPYKSINEFRQLIDISRLNLPVPKFKASINNINLDSNTLRELVLKIKLFFNKL